MDAIELEKILDLKLDVVAEKLSNLDRRVDKLIDTTKWVLAVLVIPLLMSISLLFLSKVIH